MYATMPKGQQESLDTTSLTHLKEFKFNVLNYKLPLPARSASEHFKLRYVVSGNSRHLLTESHPTITTTEEDVLLSDPKFFKQRHQKSPDEQKKFVTQSNSPRSNSNLSILIPGSTELPTLQPPKNTTPTVPKQAFNKGVSNEYYKKQN
jgi:hypothetical protein